MALLRRRGEDTDPADSRKPPQLADDVDVDEPSTSPRMSIEDILERMGPAIESDDAGSPTEPLRQRREDTSRLSGASSTNPGDHYSSMPTKRRVDPNLVVAIVAGVMAAVLTGIWLKNQQVSSSLQPSAPPAVTAPKVSPSPNSTDPWLAITIGGLVIGGVVTGVGISIHRRKSRSANPIKSKAKKGKSKNWQTVAGWSALGLGVVGGISYVNTNPEARTFFNAKLHPNEVSKPTTNKINAALRGTHYSVINLPGYDLVLDISKHMASTLADPGASISDKDTPGFRMSTNPLYIEASPPGAYPVLIRKDEVAAIIVDPIIITPLFNNPLAPVPGIIENTLGSIVSQETVEPTISGPHFLYLARSHAIELKKRFKGIIVGSIRATPPIDPSHILGYLRDDAQFGVIYGKETAKGAVLQVPPSNNVHHHPARQPL